MSQNTERETLADRLREFRERLRDWFYTPEGPRTPDVRAIDIVMLDEAAAALRGSAPPTEAARLLGVPDDGVADEIARLKHLEQECYRLTFGAAAAPPTGPSESGCSHELKTDPAVFAAVLDGRKTWEIRKDDRGFEAGDRLTLRETKYTGAEMQAGAPLVYTGRAVETEVPYLLRGPVYGLADGWVIMSIRAAAAEQTRTQAELDGKGKRMCSDCSHYEHCKEHGCPIQPAALFDYGR